MKAIDALERLAQELEDVYDLPDYIYKAIAHERGLEND